MITLKQLTLYCRDYIDLISPSLLSRQAKHVILPKEIFDATPLYQNTPEFDYEALTFSLNLAVKLADVEVDEEGEDNNNGKGIEESEQLEISIARSLDEIYRKYETSSYTKQITLKFGRVSFSGKPIQDDFSDDDDNDEFKKVEQYLFSVPVTIAYKDQGGSRHYSIVIEDTSINTDLKFLNKFLVQEHRDELVKFASKSQESTVIPLSSEYIDTLWTKIKHLLITSEAKLISEAPDLETTDIILLPKVNHFLSQDLLGIIEKAEDDDLLETSLSAWVNSDGMDIYVPADDSGSQELFFPFPYDNSQLQVLGTLQNKAAVVEGPPGTGKSQTIANILCHLAAQGKKVLFVSQKDQAVRGVKDKLKSLDIPYLYGYIPDRSSKLHTEEDEKDSAAHALKGVSQMFHEVTETVDPLKFLARLNTSKPQFDSSIAGQREFYDLYKEWQTLDQYEFGVRSLEITQDWLGSIADLKKDIAAATQEYDDLQNKIDNYISVQGKLATDIKSTEEMLTDLNKMFRSNHAYLWLKNEEALLRNLSYAEVAAIIEQVLTTFDELAYDRNKFFKSKLNEIKLKRAVDQYTKLLPRELYESLKQIIISDGTKTDRAESLRTIYSYFNDKDILGKKSETLNTDLENSKTTLIEIEKQKEGVVIKKSELRDALLSSSLDELLMERLRKIIEIDGISTFDKIHRRYELGQQIENFKSINPNLVSEQLMQQKNAYKVQVGTYIKNRLAIKAREYKGIKKYRAALESIGRKLGKSKRAYKTFDALKSDPSNFEAMSGIIPIWMMGLDDASRVLPLVDNIFDYVIIDEASQCNISYALPVMYRSKHTILFGDTLQMRDTTIAFKSNEHLQALANKHSIPEDLQIKAMEDSVKSVMDIAKLSGFQTTVLTNHYRSPMELIGFSNSYFYEPRGRKLQVINDDILAMDDGRVLKNHVIESDPSIEISEKTNLSEAYYIAQLVKKIKNDPQTKNCSIAVLSFFNEQAELLRKVITDDDVKVSIIEGIQGDEKDIVIYSFVIKSPEEKRRYTALTGESGEIMKEVNEGRVNVAFSRAKLQVHTVTSLSPPLWPEGIWIKKYLEYVEKNGRVNRLPKAEQHFDSKFEEHVYEYLMNKLDSETFKFSTQIESCGFKIDLVINNIKTGRKLAIECDGPTHFESGDGQVRISDDYERQFVLETAGWRFYRISYIDWQRSDNTAKTELLNYVKEYFKYKQTIEEVEKQQAVEYIYTPEKLEIPTDFINATKEQMAASKGGQFGRPKANAVVKMKTEMPKTKESSKISITEEPFAPTQVSEPESKEETSESRTGDFTELDEVVFSPRRSFVISLKDDGRIWINEKVSNTRFAGFTAHGFGLDRSLVLDLTSAIDSAVLKESFEKEFIISDSLKLVVRNLEDESVDIRYFKTSRGYTGYMKKGVRISSSNAAKLSGSIKKLFL